MDEQYILVTSSASSIDIRGKMPGSDFAINVFPAPGGPLKSELWTTDGGI